MPCEVRLTRDPATSGWGFRLTGGVTFNMPLTVFEVQEGGEADKRGIRVGDILLEINGMATNKLNLKEANAIVDSNDSMDLLVTNVLDEEAKELEESANNEEKEEQEFLSTRVDVSELDLLPPMPAPRPEIAQRKCWHPVVLDTNPPPIIEETTGDEEAPHKKILRNFRQAMSHKNLDPSPEKISPQHEEPVEEYLFEDNTDIAQELSMEEQLRIMQRQLAALCTLPATLHKSLAAVTEKINKLLPPDPEPELESEHEVEPEEYYQETTEEDYTHDDLSMKETTEDDLDASEKVDTEDSIQVEEEAEDEPEPEPVLTQEDIERMEKLRKMEQLNRAWPWGDEIKPVYKISDRYKVSNSKMFNNKIQDIESKMVLRKAPNLME